ncbi:MAG: hypothetical protein KDB40_19675 [Acidimicrobiales bacterium]|nr:hypothetical protein [Acidimicrobiales bacterium]MCB9392734.1 hypothetical protein [Acidimicrobiaceae bacterium]
MSSRGRSPDATWVHLPPPDLVAAVQLQPTPHIPLGSIRHLLRPLHDETGRLVDWLLFASGFDDHDAVPQYWRWRNTWRRHWPLGPLSNVESLRDVVADIEHDLGRELDDLLDALVGASGRPVQVEATVAEALITEIVTVRLALSVDDRTGWGIVDDMPARTRADGLARTWAPTDHEVVLAGTSVAAVVVRPGVGLAVLHGDPPTAAFEGVSAVDLRHDDVVVIDHRGQSLHLDQHDARPLGWLVPRSLRWHVRTVPFGVVWALLLDGLESAARVAGATGEAMVITGEVGVA